MPIKAACALCLLPLLAAAEDFGVRVVLGNNDTQSTKWDGSLSLRNGGRATSLEGWRFEAQDAILSNDSWRASTHTIRLFGAANRQGPDAIVGNGIVIQLSGVTNASTLDLKTAQGDFQIPLAAIPYGKSATFLNGRVLADRVPPTTKLTDSNDEQDYPSAAAHKGDVWLTWLEFKHHPDHNRLRANMTEAPANFDELSSAPGGDQVFARKYSNGAWSAPIAVTDAGKDLYRPAIAIDGQGRPWIFWSENTNYQKKGALPDFELWARPIANNQPGRAIKISNAAGSDVFPAATTAADGRVWVAWQGWRNGRGQIFAATQNGDAFAAPQTIASTTGNEWNAAIAAAANGAVTVAWDSYRNGHYDVFLRTFSNGKWNGEIPAATTARYEAHPSIAYAPDNRLWLAYEEGSEKWGKDMGADESSGIALYQGRVIRVRAFEPDGKPMNTAADIGAMLPGVAAQRTDEAGAQKDVTDFFQPDPARWKNRPAARATLNYTAPRNSYPRISVDASGRVWLAARSNHPTWWSGLGTVWSEYVLSYSGGEWSKALFLAHSDAVLDNRPALVSTEPGALTVFHSSDSRREFARTPGRAARAQSANVVDDPYDFDLYMSTVRLTPATAAPKLEAAQAANTAGPSPDDAAEQKQVAALRAAKVAGKYQVIRGEFHRHSEVSADGGNDGSLIDQWRYMLDAGAMDWVGCCDHDNGGGREYTWWTNQKLTDVFYTPGKFIPMFSYERSVRYPEGHRNVVFAQRGIRTLPRLPITPRDPKQRAPDTAMLYRYLKQYNGIVAMHTSGTNMGTDWRDNDPISEPVVEIYQGERQNYEMPGAPRTNKSEDSIGGWEPLGFVNLALEMGYKMAFQASSDHISTHMSYCNILTESPTREGLIDAFHKRHVYGATDNILADFRSGAHIMGDEFSTSTKPEFKVKLTGTAPFAKVHIIRDNKYVYSTQPNTATVDFTWRDAAPTPGKTSYYYVRGEQADGEIVWVSPMWITYTGK